MKIYLVMMEKNEADYDGSVLFTHVSQHAAIEFAKYLSKRNKNAIWVDEWPLESTMTYQNVQTVWVHG